MIKNALFFLVFFGLSFTHYSCNSSGNKQLTDINNSLIDLKAELNKTQEISLKSTAPRYQIVQSSLAARGTYKVDTYDGIVYQLVVDGNNAESWQMLNRIGHGSNDKKVIGQRNYEIFLSTIAMRFTYLINLNTGAVWQLFRDPNTDENFFSAVQD
jgi:hypothetical protein